MPRLFIIAGCNGAGKTTASYTVLPDQLNLDEYVNADEIAEKLSPQDPSREAIRAGRLFMERVGELLARGEDFAVETTLAARSFAKVIVDAQKLGYVVTILYFWLRSPQLAIKRVAKRAAAGGHSVPEATIERRYEQGIDNFKKVYMPICDYWSLIDNSDSEGRKIAEGGRSAVTRIYNQRLYKNIMNQAFEQTKTQD